jgi:hypothetical protein
MFDADAVEKMGEIVSTEARAKFKEEHPGTILREHIDSDLSDIVTDSSNRHGYYIFKF